MDELPVISDADRCPPFQHGSGRGGQQDATAVEPEWDRAPWRHRGLSVVTPDVSLE
jgi:hypothetical protein